LVPDAKNVTRQRNWSKRLSLKQVPDAEVEYVTDIAEIAKLGIFSTPAVVVDGQVKLTGKVPTKLEVRSWLGSDFKLDTVGGIHG